MTYTTPPAADVARFLEGYDRFAEIGAQKLRRFGIDGLPTYRHARAVVAHSASLGAIECHGDGT